MKRIKGRARSGCVCISTETRTSFMMRSSNSITVLSVPLFGFTKCMHLFLMSPTSGKYVCMYTSTVRMLFCVIMLEQNYGTCTTLVSILVGH